MTSSNLDSDPGYAEGGFFLVFLCLAGKMPEFIQILVGKFMEGHRLDTDE